MIDPTLSTTSARFPWQPSSPAPAAPLEQLLEGWRAAEKMIEAAPDADANEERRLERLVDGLAERIRGLPDRSVLVVAAKLEVALSHFPSDEQKDLPLSIITDAIAALRRIGGAA
jgi:hypothetical protein